MSTATVLRTLSVLPTFAVIFFQISENRYARALIKLKQVYERYQQTRDFKRK
jgi:hypothetical protein